MILLTYDLPYLTLPYLRYYCLQLDGLYLALFKHKSLQVFPESNSNSRVQDGTSARDPHCTPSTPSPLYNDAVPTTFPSHPINDCHSTSNQPASMYLLRMITQIFYRSSSDPNLYCGSQTSFPSILKVLNLHIYHTWYHPEAPIPQSDYFNRQSTSLPALLPAFGLPLQFVSYLSRLPTGRQCFIHPIRET